MTARTLPFFKQKLMSVARDLYLDHGWTMPRGLENAAERNPTNFSLAEWQQAKRQGVDPRWLKQTLQDCWKRSDTLGAFEHALQDRGFFLAKGDKRSFVVLDHAGEVWSLPRMLDMKTKDVRARLGGGENLFSVEDTRKTIGARMTPALRRHIDESRQQFRGRSEKLGQYKEEMTRLHRSARQKLEERQKAEFEQQTRERVERLPRGLRGLWHRLTGQYQKIRALNEMEAQADRLRQAEERQKLIEKQLEQRAVLQTQFRELRKAQAEQLLSLRADIGRYLKFSRGQEVQSPSRAVAQSPSLGLKLER
ncbi:relaxase [Rhizobium lemnae]|nr:relaxase [Rhizobium lemnae]